MDDRHRHYAMHQQQLHHQQQQQQQPNPQQPVYSAHSQILPSSHHHPQPHPLTVPPEIHPPQYHHGSHSPPWGDRGQPHPRGYDAEHLFSAVQQQLESMRDHNRDENNSRPAPENVEHHRAKTSSNSNSASNVDQQQNTSVSTIRDLNRPDETTGPPPPPPSSSASSMPESYTAPRDNQEATGTESQKEPESQEDAEKDQEKGVTWQTLVIGGKKVRYKVLGNVKMSKGAAVAGSKTSPSGKLPVVKLTKDGSPGSAGKPLKIVKLLPPGAKVIKQLKPATIVGKESDKNTQDKDSNIAEKDKENGDTSTKTAGDTEASEASQEAAGKKSKDDDDIDTQVIEPLGGTKDKKAAKQKRKNQGGDEKDGQKKKGDGNKQRGVVPKKRRSSRARKVVLKNRIIDDSSDEQEYDEDSTVTIEFAPSTSKKERKRLSIRNIRWSYQEIRALVGFLISAKKAGLYKKEWPTLKETESFWERAADCCNVVRLDKKKRSGAACAHWTHCYLKPKYITTSKMRFYFNSTEFNAPPNQYVTCKCYDPSLERIEKIEKKIEKKVKSKNKSKGKSKSRTSDRHRDRGIQAVTMNSFKETQTTVSTVSVSNGLKDFVSMLSAKDALEVADLALHYALKAKTLYNVADNFLDLCVGAFETLQKYRQANVIEEFARVLSTSRDDGLPRMQPDKMPFAMISYNIRYFNNTSPFGLTVPPPYAEWLHSMYNTFGQRFHELFEGPISDKMEIADRHPYRSVLLNVATVSKAYLKRQTDEKDKAEAENPPEELNEGPQEAIRRKQLMNKQGKSIRELMTDTAVPPLARRKLQQAFAIIQRTSNLTTPDNEPTCEHCGAAIPKPPKPPKKYVRRKRDRKRMGGEGRHKGEGKKRRMDKSGNKLMPVNLSSRQSKSNAGVSPSHDIQTSSIPIPSPRRKESFPRNLYHSPPGTGPLERMIINAPGIPPARDLPASLQDKWIPSHGNTIQEDWGVRPQQIPATAAAVAAAAAAARGVYPNHGSAAVNIMWEAGQPASGWQHEEVRSQIEQHQHQQQQQQHQQRAPMVPSTSSGSGIHIGQPQVSHTYYQ